MQPVRGNLKIAVLIGILVAGIVVQRLGLLDVDRFLGWFDIIADTWWLPPLTIIIQLFMYMTAFPGSIIMLTLGIIYQPWTATILVVAGGVSGSLAAYYFASFMSSSWTARFSKTKVSKILQNNSGFLQLCALRCLPGFPHAFINYSSGVLKVSLLPFIVSTGLGFAVKGFIYSSAIHSAFHMDDVESAINISNLWPLLVLVVFSVLGTIIQKKYFSA